MTPLERATTHNQYDLDDVNWIEVGGSESTGSQFFWECLEPYYHSLEGESLLDIGTGTGWLLEHALEGGAIRAVGIEPSTRSVEESKNKHIDSIIVNSTFEDYASNGERFNEITAVMSFTHIADLDSAFEKVHSLLIEAGRFIIIVPDYENSKFSQHNESVDVCPIDDNSYVASITRPWGTIADIIRKTSVYVHVAREVGFELVEEKGIKSNSGQNIGTPIYTDELEEIIYRLLVFKFEREVL